MQSCNDVYVVFWFTDVNNLRQVLDEVQGVIQTTNLGINLGISPLTVFKIEKDYKTIDEQKTKILFTWLQRQDIIPDMQSRLPSWSELADAVAKESTALSMNIRRKYCKMSS